jgi:hypothetical protein
MTVMVNRLTGVYHADGGLLGELTYVVGKALGRTHCGLCDVTHSGLRRRAAWDHLVRDLGVPMDLVHLNERSDQVRLVSEGRTPCVLAHHDDGTGATAVTEVLTAAELDDLGGDLTAFGKVLACRLPGFGLTLPPAGPAGPDPG